MPDQPLPTRRGLLRGALGVAALAVPLSASLVACERLDPDGDSPQDGPGRRGGAGPRGADDPAEAADGTADGDAALVAEVRRDLAAMAALTARTARRHPGLRPRLAPLAELHRAHALALETGAEGSGSRAGSGAAPTPERSPAALAAVRAAEQEHRARLAEAAVDAGSGPLARLLASMSAAVAQHLGVSANGSPTTSPHGRPGAPTPDAAAGTVEALNVALAAEHAAVHVYGVLGAQTSQSAEPALFAAVGRAYTAHRAHRDRLVRTVRDLGGTPVAAEAAYRLPPRLTAPGTVQATARDLEAGSARTWAWVVAHTSGEQRRLAVAALDETAVRVLAFRGTPETFPGTDEHADR